jgi:peroxiredoxin (alkyl hydroperoxide reductase subunit C)
VSVIAAGMPAPEFALRREDGERFTQADLLGTRTVLVFYPAAFSPVCTDQMQIYAEALPEIAAQGAVMYGVSCDAPYAQTAFREKLGVTIPQLSDFEPKGAASRAFGAFFEPAGTSTRALVITNAEGVVTWSWEGEHPGVLPGVNLVMDALAAA